MNTLPKPSPQLVEKTKKSLPTRVVADPMTPKQRAQAAAFKAVCGHIERCNGDSRLRRIESFIAAFNAKMLPAELATQLAVLRGKKKDICPDKATIYRWFEKMDKFADGNSLALTKQYKGRQRTLYGWEHLAIDLFNMPSKPAYADVAYWLRTDHGFESATVTRVTAYLKTLPETLGKQSPGRMGKHYYNLNIKPHTIRDNEVLPIGYGYEGDGHTVDVYVAHPVTGNLYRPEMTVWIDVRSRFAVGWYLSDAESAVSTLFALSHAIVLHNHVPAVLFVDNGSGYKSRMMNDEVTGYYSRMSITPSWCIPGNSKGKGLVEGFFKIYRNRLDKKYQTYCGDDMSQEVNRRLPEMVKRRIRTLPTLAEYAAAVRKFIEDYNDTPKKCLGGKTPRQVWDSDWERTPVHMSADAIIRPRVIRTVRKWRVQLDNRFYEAAELAQYNTREVIVEYSLHDDAHVWIYDDQQRLVCTARLIGKLARQSESRIKDNQQKRLDGQIKRLEAHAHEKRLQAQPALTHEDSLLALDGLVDDSPKPAELDDFNPLDSLYLGEPENDEGDDDFDIDATFGL